MAVQSRNCVTVDDFRRVALEMWGAESRTGKQLFDRDLPRIQEHVDFGCASAELKVHLAETMIRESTRRCGAYEENGDPRWYLLNFGREIAVRNPVFDVRRTPSIQAAIMLLAYQDIFLFQHEREEAGDLALVFGMGGSGVASMYLLGQLEYLFRVKGDYLTPEGALTQSPPATLASLKGLQRKRVGNQVNQIQLAFLLYLDGSSDPLRQRLIALEQDVQVSARLSNIRPPTMHGSLGDSSSEGLFYALVMAMFYYSEPHAAV